MHIAAENGDSRLVQFILLKFENSCHQKDINGYIPIHRAAQNGHLEVVKTLANFTENPNVTNFDGLTPIHLAAMNGHTEVVKYLSKFTKTPNAPDNNGVTPFLLALWNRRHTSIDTRMIHESLNNSD